MRKSYAFVRVFENKGQQRGGNMGDDELAIMHNGCWRSKTLTIFSVNTSL